MQIYFHVSRQKFSMARVIACCLWALQLLYIIDSRYFSLKYNMVLHAEQLPRQNFSKTELQSDFELMEDTHSSCWADYGCHSWVIWRKVTVTYWECIVYRQYHGNWLKILSCKYGNWSQDHYKIFILNRALVYGSKHKCWTLVWSEFKNINNVKFS